MHACINVKKKSFSFSKLSSWSVGVVGVCPARTRESQYRTPHNKIESTSLLILERTWELENMNLARRSADLGKTVGRNMGDQLKLRLFYFFSYIRINISWTYLMVILVRDGLTEFSLNVDSLALTICSREARAVTRRCICFFVQICLELLFYKYT